MKTLGEIFEDHALARFDVHKLKEMLGDQREVAHALEGQLRRAKSKADPDEIREFQDLLQDSDRECKHLEKVLRRANALLKAGTYESERARLVEELMAGGWWDPRPPLAIVEGFSEAVDRMSYAFKHGDLKKRKEIERLNSVIQSNALWGILPVLFAPVKKKAGAKTGRRYPQDALLLKKVERLVSDGMTVPAAAKAVAKRARNQVSTKDSVAKRLKKIYNIRNRPRAGSAEEK